MKLTDLNESVPAMDYSFAEADYEATPQAKALASLGRTLMDMSAKMPMKGASDEEIDKSNKMSALGDALTRWGTSFGPKSVKDLIKTTGLEANEIQDMIKMAQEAGPTKPVAADPEPEDDEEDEFDAPDDDAMAAKADRMARKGK
jgi:hypothetical protein